MLRYFAIGLIGFLTASASAQVSGIYVEFWNTTTSDWQNVAGFPPRTNPGLPGGSNITFTAQPNATYRIYAASPSTTDIGTITVNGPDPQFERTVLVGVHPLPVFSETVQLPGAGARHLAGFFGNSPNTRLQVFLTGDTTGTVTAYKLGACRVDGSVNARFQHNPGADPSAGDMGFLELGAVGSGGDLRSVMGDIPEVAVSGNIDGAINVLNGNLGDVDCTFSGASGAINDIIVNGDIGTTAQSATIIAASGIDLIDSDAIYADIDANANGGTGHVRRIITKVGPFEGSLDATTVGTTSIPDWLNVRTVLDAVVTIEQPTSSGCSSGTNSVPTLSSISRRAGSRT